VHITEPSNASSTGLYDPYQQNWGHMLLRIVGFPCEILPEIRNTAGAPLATVHPSVCGISIPIGAVVADAQCAAFGCGCLKENSLKISLGTGTFVDLVTGDKPHASMKGVYPLVGWKVEDDTTFLVEGCSHDTASVLLWAHSIGLYQNVEETSAIASSAKPQEGLYFIPAFNGIQTPIDDDAACAAFFGIHSGTTKTQLLRAILESIAFRVYQIYQTMDEEISDDITTIRCCGGVAKNDFICQLIATLIGRPVDRTEDAEFSCAKGAALLAGITAGLWQKNCVSDFVTVERVFKPVTSERQQALGKYKKWRNTLDRCLNYY
jgi:putative glycerol kinase 5